MPRGMMKGKAWVLSSRALTAVHLFEESNAGAYPEVSSLDQGVDPDSICIAI